MKQAWNSRERVWKMLIRHQERSWIVDRNLEKDFGDWKREWRISQRVRIIKEILVKTWH